MSNNKSTVSLNMPVLSVEKATDILTDTYIPVIEKGISPKVLPSVMLWGPPGVGKSQAIRQIAKNIEKQTDKKVNTSHKQNRALKTAKQQALRRRKRYRFGTQNPKL